MPALALALALPLALALGACASRAVDVRSLPASPGDFMHWRCERIDDELDRVQQRAADVAYAVDELAGNNILALGVGLTLFWPALMAMRPDGPEAAELAQLKGRFEALHVAARQRGCDAGGLELPAARLAAMPVAVGDRLVYEDRRAARAATESALRVQALRRGEIEYLGGAAEAARRWRQDLAGNRLSAPVGDLQWPGLLRGALEPGQVTAGDIVLAGDSHTRARMRGQVVAVGPQTIDGLRFDAAVIELFGDTQLGEVTTRVAGVLVVDRVAGVLLRLELASAQAAFALDRRLVRVEPAPR